MTPQEVSSVMDQAVDSLRSLHAAAQQKLNDTWFVLEGKETVQGWLNNSMTRINYLDTELHQQVLSGERPFSLFREIADEEAVFLQKTAGFAGKWALSPVLANVVLDTGANIASGLKVAAGTTDSLLSAAKWIVAGVVVWKAAEIIGIFKPRKSNA